MNSSTISVPIGVRGKSSFLDGLAPYDLKVILANARERRFRANSVIIHQGEPANHLFLLTKGRARLFYMTEEGHKTLLVWLTPGKVFGGGALIPKPSLYLVSTEAKTECWALVWDSATIRGLAARYPRLMQNAFLLASEYLGWHLVDHVALICQTAQQRLGYLLTSLTRVIGQKVPGGIELDATNEELASASNVSHFTVSRLLSEWQRNHAIEKRRGKILVRSIERLTGQKNVNGRSNSKRRHPHIVRG